MGWDGLVPGTAYTITEAAEPGYINGAVNCDGDGTFTPSAGAISHMCCDEHQFGSVDVTKTVEGTGDDVGI